MVVEAKVRLLATRLRCPLCLEPLEAGAPASSEPPATCPACATCYHAACVAELGVACATLGCALGPKAPPRRGGAVAGLAVRPRRGLVWPLVFTWVFYVVAWPLGLATWAWALYRAWRRPRRLRALTAAVLLSPFGALPLGGAALAVHGYATGSAVLTIPSGWDGSHGPPLTGLDPEVRCPVRRGGLALGPALPDRTNELALRVLGRLFGPMVDGYTGRLPSPQEAHALLAAAPPMTAELVDTLAPFAFDEDRDGRLRLTLEGEPLDVAVAPDLYWPWVRGEASSSPARAVRIARLDGAGLLVELLPEREQPDRLLINRRALVVDLARRRAVSTVWPYPFQ